MTFATIDTRETNTVKFGSIKTFGAAVLALSVVRVFGTECALK